MCGISGICANDRSAIGQMNAVQMHRGPDAAGVFEDEVMALGHTLLSVRGGISDSRQPVFEKGSPWVLAFNGQIYNTKSILTKLDDSDRDDTLDTTILFRAIKKYGWEFINHIQGMFAIVLYNQDEHVLRMYRDSSGQLPLYYYWGKQRLVFASEIKAILQCGEVPVEPDEVAVQWAARAGYVPLQHTLLKSVHKLLPGEILKWGQASASIAMERIPAEPTDDISDLRQSFGELVALHLQSRHQVALNLSGGLDSSILLHEMSELGYSVVSYTSHYEGASVESNSEARLASRLAKHYGAEHREISVRSDDFWDRFVRGCELVEEPNGNIAIPLYLKMAEAEGRDGDGMRVLMTGCGGDELFYGYSHHDQNYRIDQWLKWLPPSVLSFLYRMRYGRTVRFERPMARWLFNRGYHRHYLHQSPEDLSQTGNEDEWAEEYLRAYGISKEGVYEGLLMDRCAWLAGENFNRMNKLFMSQSIETRCPFSYAPFRAAVDQKLCALPYRSRRSRKAALRRCYAGQLPDYIVNRKQKVGWHAPLEEWYSPKARDLFQSLFAGRKGPLIDWSQIRKVVEQTSRWPGKAVHLYASLAILSDYYGIEI